MTVVVKIKSKLFVLAVADKQAPPFDRPRGGVDQYLNGRIGHCSFCEIKSNFVEKWYSKTMLCLS